MFAWCVVKDAVTLRSRSGNHDSSGRDCRGERTTGCTFLLSQRCIRADETSGQTGRQAGEKPNDDEYIRTTDLRNVYIPTLSIYKMLDVRNVRSLGLSGLILSEMAL